MPSIPSSASPDLTSSNLNGLMIASIFFMSGNHPGTGQKLTSPAPTTQRCHERVRGSATPSKSTSSQGTHAHGLLSRLNPVYPVAATPQLHLRRELTFGTPPE